MSTETAYINKLRELIPQVRLACGFALPTNSKDFDLEVLSWNKLLCSEIPLEVLEQTVFAAIKSKSKKNAEQERLYMKFGADDVIAYWHEQKYINKERQRRKILLNKRCRSCKGTKQVTTYDPIKKIDVTVSCPYCTIPQVGTLYCSGCGRPEHLGTLC